MNEEERNREVEKRERLVQTFLIISGFLVAYTGEDFRRLIVLIFSTYLIFTILYYISLSRTRKNLATDLSALASSYLFSLLILAFFSLQLTEGMNDWDFYSLFILLTVIFIFALLSPESSEKINNLFEKISKGFEEKHPKLQKICVVLAVIIIVVWTTYLYLVRRA